MMSISKHSLLIAFGIACIFMVGFSLANITENPPVWYDEGLFSQVAAHIASGEGEVLQLAPDDHISAWHMSAGWPLFYPIALFYKLFGVGVLQGRLVMLLFLVLFVGASFIAMKRLFGDRIAVASLALLATFPVLYGTGLSVLGEVPGMAYLMLFLLALIKIERDQFSSPLWLYFLGAFAAGMCVTTKPIFLLLLPAIAIVGFARMRTIPWRLSWVLVACAGGLLPILWWLYSHILGAQTGSVATYYANPYQIEGTSLFDLMILNTKHLFTDFSALYVTVPFLLWSAALYIRRKTVTLAEGVAYVFSLLILLAYVRTAGWHRYFFEAELLSLLFVPIVTATALERFKIPKAKQVFAGFIAIICIFQLYLLFFNSWMASHAQSGATKDMQDLFSSIPKDKSIFFIDTPELVLFAQRDNYYQGLPNVVPAQPGLKYLPELKNGIADIAVLREVDKEKYAPYLGAYAPVTAKNGYLFLEHAASK